MKRNITDIIGELVSRISTKVTAVRVESSGLTTKIWTCDVGYAKVGDYLGDYVILEVGSNYIIVDGVTSDLEYDLQDPYYRHGTVIHVNQELTNAINNSDRPVVYPMIYFPESLGTIESGHSRLSLLEMTASVRLIFASNYNANWTTDEFTQLGINPMIQLFDRLRKVIEADPFLDPNRKIRYREIHKSILGTYANDKGYVNNLLNDRVGGIVVEFELEVLRNFACSCCCDIPDAPTTVNMLIDNNSNQFIDNTGNQFIVVT